VTQEAVVALRDGRGPTKLFGPTVRTFLLVGVVASAIIASSYALGRSTGAPADSAEARGAARSAAHAGAETDSATAAKHDTGSVQAPDAAKIAGNAAAKAAAPAGGTAAGGRASAQKPRPVASVQQGSVAMSQPIVGPGRPPLLPDKGGPAGARRTTGSRAVALTFDDGPDPTFTPQVLTLLRRYHVKATFCLVGQNAQAFPQLVRAIVADGHTLCNHSWQHDTGLGRRSKAAIRSDLERTNAAILRAAPGARVSYFRQPGGMWTSAVVAVAKQLGMSSLHWEVDPQDWRKPGAGSIVATVNAGTVRGAIVLLHDAGGDRRGTVTALRTILPNLTRRFQLVALPPGIDPPSRYGIDMPLHPGQV
jgi:peptidoglycan/xylan/chitin deacetylase (PgdA/CDA1 family)